MCPTPEFAAPASPSRRSFLLTLGLVLNGLALLLAGVPILRYVLGPLSRRAPQTWIDLGPVAGFPERETRLAA